MNARTSLRQNSTHSSRSSYFKSERTHVPRRKQRHSRRVKNLHYSQRAASLAPTEQDRLLRQSSLAEARRGNHTSAIAGLNLLVERNPLNANDYNNRGLVYFQSGQFAAAVADYNQAIRLNPRLASAYNNRANYYAAQGALAEALADYETAIDLDPINIRAWINQGITFRELELYSEAIENFDHALQITQLLASGASDTTLLEGHLYGARGRSYHLLGDWNYALADYHRALEQFSASDTIDSASHQLLTQIDNWIHELLCGNEAL